VSSFLSIRAGLFLRMRQATDPDHVIAVTTIVSSQRNRMRAPLIRASWGVGHTVTIFAVGAIPGCRPPAQSSVNSHPAAANFPSDLT
jgi:hypothetical protein